MIGIDIPGGPSGSFVFQFGSIVDDWPNGPVARLKARVAAVEVNVATKKTTVAGDCGIECMTYHLGRVCMPADLQRRGHVLQSTWRT